MCWQGVRCPMFPVTGCCHVGACCLHSLCWTGCTQAMMVPCVGGLTGRMPCAAGSWLCMHGGFGFHKILQCEACCLELDCHQPGEHGFKCKSPEFRVNKELFNCSCDSEVDFLKHFCMQCGVCCCHWWCTKQACLGMYCKQPSTICDMAMCSQFCCCFASDFGCSHLQWCGCCCCVSAFNCCDRCITHPMSMFMMSLRGHGEWVLKNSDPRMASFHNGMGSIPIGGGGFGGMMAPGRA